LSCWGRDWPRFPVPAWPGGAYTLDLRQFASWYRARSPALFAVRRAGIESFVRELEAMGRSGPPSRDGRPR
jgi:hypothetical protein